VIVGYGLANSKVNIQLGPQIGQNLVGILMYGFGLFAAYKYSTLGLRIVRITSRLFLHNSYKKCFMQVDFDNFSEKLPLY